MKRKLLNIFFSIQKQNRILGIIFLLGIWCPEQLFGQVAFTDMAVNLPGTGVGATAWGDYDNDGDLDILITGLSAESYIYSNNGGVFTNIMAGLPGVRMSAAAWGDYDSDGDLDILLTGNGTNGKITKIFRNDNGLFTDIIANLPGVSYGAVAWGDYDNDGDLDFILTGETNGGLGNNRISQLYRNDSGTFILVPTSLPGVYLSSVAWGDGDNDGDLDLILTGVSNVFVGQVFRNTGGSFTNLAFLDGVAEGSVAWGDYDKDGDLDILLTGQTSNYNAITKVYRNNAAGTFTTVPFGLINVAQSAVAWGDYDNDGDLDILLSGQGSINATKHSKVYRNTGSSFSDTGANLTPTYLSSVAWGDYDGDGDLDILITGYSVGGTKLYRNNSLSNTAGINTPPAVITGLASTATQTNKINLFWNKATDSQTPVNGISYNLRIGTTPGSGNLFSSQANYISGYRRLSKAGSIQDTTYTLTLPLGNYYWSVQAIDAGFIGGVWSPEQSFSISATATFCQGGSVVINAPSTVPGGTYQWYLNGTPIVGATNAAYTATTGGSYTVTTISGSVSNTSSATVVTVKPVTATPTITAGSATTICVGDAVNLIALSNTAGVTYQWFYNGIAITGPTSGSFSATFGGSYTVVATSNGCPSLPSSAITVAVNPLPAPAFTGLNASYCATDPAVTLASSIPGSTFTINGTAATTFNPATLGPGTYTVVVSSTNAQNCTGTATQTITISAPPVTPTVTGGGGTTICAGSPVVLTAASATTGATYQWFNNGYAIAGATAATFTANAAGSYTVVGTANGCPSAASAATAVTVTPLPPTPTISQNGGTLTSSSATGIQWFLNGTAIPGATGQNYITTANGAYTLQVTANGCTSALSAVTNLINTGINPALAGMSVEVYPNPATGSFNVKLNGYQKDATVMLYSITGQLIAIDKVAADGKAKNIATKGLTAGVYILKVNSQNMVRTSRLFIQ